jgi:hypothetical protein
METKTEPSPRRARITAAALILAATAAIAANPTKEAGNLTPPPQEVKNTQKTTPETPGERAEKPGETPKTIKQPPTEPQPTPDFASQAEAKAALAAMFPNPRDAIILTEIIQCESGWSHFWEPNNWAGKPAGTVKVSSGNVGFGQLNRSTWQSWLQKNHGLDIYKEKDNLKGTAIIYLRSGVNPWKPYSGSCWLPKLKAQGIEL